MQYNIESDNIERIRVEVNSSLIDFLEYSRKSLVLQVRFIHGKHKGKVRTYEDIVPQQFYNLLEAHSVGKALIHLLDQYKSNKEYI